MNKQYQAPAIKVRHIDSESIMAASVNGTTVNDQQAGNGVTGLSKGNNLWDNDDESYSPWSNNEDN